MRSWPWRIVLALLLSVVSTPAREVEAASDLARTVAEVGEPGRVEEVDGGVGDDQLEAPRPNASIQSIAPLVGEGWAGPPRRIVGHDPFPLRVLSSRIDASANPPFASSATRLAWLQRFLF